MPYYSYNIIKKLYYNTYNFTYDGETSNEDLEERVLEKYIKDDESGLEIPDILTNVNGAHVYKLISAKDIDWDNVFLPNSMVSSQNWASFDKDRKWDDDTPIHINDVYELLNAIDYLLYSCSELWSEINKLKYGTGKETKLWFLKDTFSILNSDDISEEGNKKGNKYNIGITVLDPTKPATVVNIPDFSIGTTFYPSGNESGSTDKPAIRRIFITRGNKNGIQGFTNELQTDYNYDKSQTAITEGEMITIYAYKINNGNNEIKFFPGFNFDNYINSNKVYKAKDIIDVNNKKLKYNNVYFRINKTENEYARVYCEFLRLNSKTGYILYYKDNTNDKKNQIIYISDNISNELPDNLHLDDFNILPDNNLLNGHSYEENNKVYPWFFVCNDEFTIDLTVETPQIGNTFEIASKTITLYYYKDENEIKTNIYINDDINKGIKKVTDTTQNSSLLDNKQRYNIPDNTDVNIKIDATWINNNPDILYDDEYMDYPVFSNDITSEDYDKYYIYNTINNDKRVFTEVTDDFINNQGNKFNDINSNVVLQLYRKNEHPYKLSYEISPNQFIVQDIPYADVKNEINKINSENHLYLHQDEDNTYILTLNHLLPDTYEQIKFDLNLEIEETSKVKGTTYKLPINLNKVHNPKLHYINWQDTSYEYNSYFNFDVYEGTSPIDNTGNGRFPSFPDSKMFRLCYNYSINSYMVNGIYNVNKDYAFTEQELESNTDTNPIIISYHPTKSIVNLIGSNMTIAYLYNKEKRGQNSHANYANSYISNSYILNNNGDYQDIKYYLLPKDNFDLIKINQQSLFNIYNLGKNFRFNSNNNKYVHPTSNNIPQNVIKYNINASSSIRNSTDNDIKSDNIAYFLNFKISNNNELVKTYYIDNIEYTNQYKYFDNTIYTIKTDLFNIYKTTYATHYATSNSENAAIFTPICYMNINTSSFMPINSNNLPSNNETHQYDLTNDTDKQKYKNYIESWASDNNNELNNLKLTYINLKLQENLDRGIPFFNETNEATTYFKVKRYTNSGENSLIKGRIISGKNVKILLNKKYYLTDLINVLPETDDKYKTSYIGSYPEWNEEKNKYEIIEIYDQNEWPIIKTLSGPSESSTFIYINYKDDYLKYISNETNISDSMVNSLIPEKYKNIYNFLKLAEINKLSMNLPTSSDNSYQFDDLGLFKLLDIPNNLIYNDNGLNQIELIIPINKIYGNLRYGDKNTSNAIPKVNIIPVYREKNNDSLVNSELFIEKTIQKSDNSQITIQILNFDESKKYYYKDGEEYKEIVKPVITISESGISIPDNFDQLLRNYKKDIINYFEANNLYPEGQNS